MRLALWVLGSVVVAGRLAAQAPGLPVVNAGVARGLTLHGMVGFPNQAAGDGTALGVGAALGARRVGVGAFVSRIGGSGDDRFAGGGNLTVKVLGGPLVPVAVNLQAGAAYYTTPVGQGATAEDLGIIHVPVGLGISWTIARPVVALKPWIAPRADYTRVSAPSGSLALVDQDRVDFALSGGISFGFLNGLSLDLAVDRVFAGGSTQKPTTVGAGVSVALR